MNRCAVSCGNISASNPNLLDIDENYGPWVKIKFRTSGQTITVGNKSNPKDPNKAAIISWQYGFSVGGGVSGSEVKVEISDEDGGNFSNFIKRTVNATTEKVSYGQLDMEMDWGWTSIACGATTGRTIPNPTTIKVLVRDVDVSLSSGKLTYTINGFHGVNILSNMNADREPQGSETNAMPLKEAIKELYKKYGMNVKFLTKTSPTDSCGKRNCGKSPCWEWKFKESDGGCKGPQDTWRPDNKDANTAVLTWLSELTTVDDKGFTIGVDMSEDVGTVIIWEAGGIDCDGKGINSTPLATYIVNGGKCSPVLSFNPKYKFSGGFPNNQGGNFSNTSAGPVDSDDVKECDYCSEGTPAKTPPAQNGERRNLDDAQPKQEKANQENIRAQSGFQTVKGELVIVGDPKFDNPVFIVGKQPIKIVVINPYFVDMPSPDNCGSWKISGGKYTTTFELELATPGYDMNKGLKLGGANGSVELNQ
jgi:hypothetical protein